MVYCPFKKRERKGKRKKRGLRGARYVCPVQELKCSTEKKYQVHAEVKYLFTTSKILLS